MMIDPMKLAEWQEKAIAGTMTLDESKQAIAALRAGRLAAASAPRKASSSAKAPIDTAAMLSDLGLD